MKKLFLFDIDGTLINGGGAGRKALDRAFLKIFGLEEASKNTRLDGKTDRGIVREMVTSLSLSNSKEEAKIESMIDRTIAQYLQFLPEEVSRAEQYRVLPGIETLLPRLKNHSDTVLGIASGNVKQGAKIKLDRASLYDFFPIGGFGCDSEKRFELVDAAIKRAEELTNERFQTEKIYLIGDTHFDIEAGKTLGIQTVAVATGSFSPQDLATSKPNFIFSDFSDVDYFFSTFSL